MAENYCRHRMHADSACVQTGSKHVDTQIGQGRQPTIYSFHNPSCTPDASAKPASQCEVHIISTSAASIRALHADFRFMKLCRREQRDEAATTAQISLTTRTWAISPAQALLVAPGDERLVYQPVHTTPGQ